MILRATLLFSDLCFDYIYSPHNLIPRLSAATALSLLEYRSGRTATREEHTALTYPNPEEQEKNFNELLLLLGPTEFKAHYPRSPSVYPFSHSLSLTVFPVFGVEKMHYSMRSLGNLSPMESPMSCSLCSIMSHSQLPPLSRTSRQPISKMATSQKPPSIVRSNLTPNPRPLPLAAT